MSATGNKAKERFLSLANVDAECEAVDAENGCWIKCGVCESIINPHTGRPFNIIAPKKDSPFTIGRWNEHKKTDAHSQNLRVLRKASLEAKEKDGTISRLERMELNQQFRKKQKLIPFKVVVPAEKAASTTASAEVQVVNENAALKPPSVPAASSVPPSSASSKLVSKTCEGIIKGYRSDDVLQKNIKAYAQFCAIDISSGYVAGQVEWRNQRYQMFASDCILTEMSYEKNGDIYQCCKCKEIL